MRFPVSGTGFYHYADMLGLKSKPFPNPLVEASHSTVIDLEGETYYAEKQADLPPIFQEVAAAWYEALEEGSNFSAMQKAIRARNVQGAEGDLGQARAACGTTAAFMTSSPLHRLSPGAPSITARFSARSASAPAAGIRTIPNSMLEILRVVVTNCDDNQRWIVGGVEQVPRGLWKCAPEKMVHWPKGTSLEKLHAGAPRPAVVRIARSPSGHLAITDRWGSTKFFDACLVTCHSWLLTTYMQVEERIFSPKLWMALDRTRFMQSAKTFIMVDRPFWKDKDPRTGRDLMSMTLTDRLTRGTYLFDNGDDKPGVICLSYSWMSDAMKMLPLPVDKRVKLSLDALKRIYPTLDIESHIIGDPITVSWETDPNFLGAFKGALPGHYRYNHRMYCHFMQDEMPPDQKGIFMAGDGVSWTPGWVEGAVQTGLNAVWGIVKHLGGETPKDNPGPGDRYDELKPIELPDETSFFSLADSV